MQVKTANAPASVLRAGKRFYFCSDRCRMRFEADPERYPAKEAKRERPVEPVSVAVSFGRTHKD